MLSIEVARRKLLKLVTMKGLKLVLSRNSTMAAATMQGSCMEQAPTLVARTHDHSPRSQQLQETGELPVQQHIAAGESSSVEQRLQKDRTHLSSNVCNSNSTVMSQSSSRLHLLW